MHSSGLCHFLLTFSGRVKEEVNEGRDLVHPWGELGRDPRLECSLVPRPVSGLPSFLKCMVRSQKCNLHCKLHSLPENLVGREL